MKVISNIVEKGKENSQRNKKTRHDMSKKNEPFLLLSRIASLYIG